MPLDKDSGAPEDNPGAVIVYGCFALTFAVGLILFALLVNYLF